MSKRGGSSEINGFISLRSDDKKSSKRKDDSATTRRSDESTRRKRDSSKELSQDTTQNRTRVSDKVNKKETSKVADRKDLKTSTKSVVIKSELSSSKKTEKKQINKKDSTSIKTKKSDSGSGKPGDLSLGKVTSHSEAISSKYKESSSPYVAGKNVKPKIVQNSPQLKRQSLIHTTVSKDSPSRSLLAQKNQPHSSLNASGNSSKKNSQLSEKNSKLKSLAAGKQPSKSRKPLVNEPERHKKGNSTSSSHKSKSVNKILKEPVNSNSEEIEIHQKVRPFGEIPRSNTFTKEEGALESLTSDLSLSYSQDQSYSSACQLEADDYEYDDDFEDYESDFEDYVESEESSDTASEVDDSSEGAIYSDNVEYKTDDLLSKREYTDNEQSHNTTVLNISNDPILAIESEKEKQHEKEKSLTVEEERKLDSGSYDLASHSDSRRKKQIQEIRAAINKENSSFDIHQDHRKMRPFPEDEGFVEVFSQETSPTYLDTIQPSTEGLINFSNARKQQIKQKAKAKVKKRGTLLMEMIRLDIMSFNLLDIPSVPYEVYMKCYGRSNTFQIHTQTNEDALSEEVQTDDITTTAKWTQHPVKYSSPLPPECLLSTFSQEKLGVGGETTVNDTEDWFPRLHVNSLKLHNFINNAGEMILTLLEENAQDSRLEINSSKNNRDFGFSNSFTSLNVGKVNFLKGRTVSLVSFSESNSSHILTVHKSSTEPLTVQAESEGRCILCIWSVKEPSCPLQTLVASNNVLSVCYHSHLVFAGLIDGAICLWDLREKTAIHSRSFLKQPDWLLRSPTYISANLDREKRHFSSIVSMKILPDINSDDSAKSTSDRIPTQLASLDEDGLLVIWTIVETKSAVNIDSGLAPWGKVWLVPSSHLKVLKVFSKSMEGAMQCRCLAVDMLKPSNLYIGTNSGNVVHCLQTSTRAKPQLYTTTSEGNASITCIEFSRCKHPLIMVGDTAGRVQIYRTMTERPLLDISASGVTPGPAIKCLQWSSVQDGLFFVLDANSCIHVWDLCTSDMCPQFSTPFTSQRITSISLTHQSLSRMLAISSEDGTVDIYNLKAEFGALSKKDSDELHDIFTRYITIL